MAALPPSLKVAHRPAVLERLSMVNPGKIVKGRKSKRQTLHNKHKIERKVREHHRKERRDARRNPQLHRKKKDPGIPNSWPFKQQMIQAAVCHAATPSLRASSVLTTIRSISHSRRLPLSRCRSFSGRRTRSR